MDKDGSNQKFGLIVGLLSVAAAVIGALAAIHANIQASESLKIAQEANAIAEEANQLVKEQQQAHLVVSHQFSFQRWKDEHTDPCVVESQDIRWDTEFVIAFDVTNSGGAPTSLSNVDIDSRLDVRVPLPDIEAYVWLYYFGTDAQLRDWYYELAGPADSVVLPSLERFTVSGPPIQVLPGETKRLILRGDEQVFVSSTFGPPQDVHDRIRSSTDWMSSLTFVFADGSSQSVDFSVPRPFTYWEPSSVYVPGFDACN